MPTSRGGWTTSSYRLSCLRHRQLVRNFRLRPRQAAVAVSAGGGEKSLSPATLRVEIRSPPGAVDCLSSMLKDTQARRGMSSVSLTEHGHCDLMVHHDTMGVNCYPCETECMSSLSLSSSCILRLDLFHYHMCNPPRCSMVEMCHSSSDILQIRIDTGSSSQCQIRQGSLSKWKRSGAAWSIFQYCTIFASVNGLAIYARPLMHGSLLYFRASHWRIDFNQYRKAIVDQESKRMRHSCGKWL